MRGSLWCGLIAVVSALGCKPVVIAPGESILREFGLRASVAASRSGEGIQPMDPGAYSLTAEPRGWDVPRLTVDFEVR